MGFVWTFRREVSGLGDALSSLLNSDAHWRTTSLAMGLTVAASTATQVEPALVEDLSSRELEVLLLLPTHLSTVELARRLYVSSNTVRSHIKAIYRKLDVNSRSEAVHRASGLGLLTKEASTPGR